MILIIVKKIINVQKYFLYIHVDLLTELLERFCFESIVFSLNFRKPIDLNEYFHLVVHSK